MAGVGSVVCLLLRVCAVVLSLLLIAGDIERNPGPTDKEGTPMHSCSFNECLFTVVWFHIINSLKFQSLLVN